MSRLITLPPESQLAPALNAYREAQAAKRQQFMLGSLVLLLAVIAAGYGAEVNFATFFSKIGNFTSYFDRLMRLDSGLRVWQDPRIAEPIVAWRAAPCGTGADFFHVISRSPENFVMEAELACPALVRVGDAWYPGWRSRVDGEKRPVQELDSVRAVQVDAGKHRIEFYYRPSPVYWGLGLTLLGLGITAFVCKRQW